MQIFIPSNSNPTTIIGNIVTVPLLNKISLMSSPIPEACLEKIAKQISFLDFLDTRSDPTADPKI